MMAGIDSKNREKESRFLLFFDFLTYLHFYKNGEKYYSFPRCYVQVFLTNIFPFQSPLDPIFFERSTIEILKTSLLRGSTRILHNLWITISIAISLQSDNKSSARYAPGI